MAAEAQIMVFMCTSEQIALVSTAARNTGWAARLVDSKYVCSYSKMHPETQNENTGRDLLHTQKSIVLVTVTTCAVLAVTTTVDAAGVAVVVANTVVVRGHEMVVVFFAGGCLVMVVMVGEGTMMVVGSVVATVVEDAAGEVTRREQAEETFAGGAELGLVFVKTVEVEGIVAVVVVVEVTTRCQWVMSTGEKFHLFLTSRNGSDDG